MTAPSIGSTILCHCNGGRVSRLFHFVMARGPDTAYSWVIAVACCWVTFVIQGLVRSGGVVYVALIDAYDVSRAQASWPFTLRLAVWNLSGPLAGALCYRWSVRTIALGGVLLVTVTNVICYLLHDILLITVFLGGLQGLGVGMAVTLVPFLINQYFVRYKSTGAGIACAGATAGSFALPPLVEWAVEEYGLDGAFLAMAGITLNGLLGAALMRPATWLKSNPVSTVEEALTTKGDQNLNFLTAKTKSPPGLEEIETLLDDAKKAKPIKTVRFSCSDDNEDTIELNEDHDNNLVLTNNSIIIVENALSSDESPNKLNPTKDLNSKPTYGVESLHPEYVEYSRQTDEKSVPTQYQDLQLDGKIDYDPQINLEQVYVPMQNGSMILKPALINGQCKSTQLPPNSKKRSFLEPLRAACEILKSPMFMVIASNYSIFFLSYMTYLIVIVDHSMDLGIDRADCVFLVSAFSIADLCGRLGSGWITDSGVIKRKHLMTVNMILFGLLLVATSFATTYATVTAVSVCCGLVVGVNLIIFYALLEEYLGLRKLPMAIGLMNFSIGIVSLITPLLTGYFRDNMGSYDHLFHLLGGVSIFCGCLWVVEPILATRGPAIS